MSKPKGPLSALRYFALISEIGFTMVANIVLGLFVGNWLDQRLNTGPLFLFILITLGVLSGLKTVYTLIKKLEK